MSTPQEFINWLLTAQGFGVAVVFVTGLVKAAVHQVMPPTEADAWCDRYAMAVSGVVSVVLAIVMMLAVRNNVATLLDPYWQFILLAVSIWGGSQLLYGVKRQVTKQL